MYKHPNNKQIKGKLNATAVVFRLIKKVSLFLRNNLKYH